MTPARLGEWGCATKEGARHMRTETQRKIDAQIMEDMHKGRTLKITETEMAFFLIDQAIVLAGEASYEIGGDIREWMERNWWEWCGSLSGPVRVDMQAAMREVGVPLPNHPGDDVMVGKTH